MAADAAIRVLIADDHGVVREGLRTFLQLLCPYATNRTCKVYLSGCTITNYNNLTELPAIGA